MQSVENTLPADDVAAAKSAPLRVAANQMEELLSNLKRFDFGSAAEAFLPGLMLLFSYRMLEYVLRFVCQLPEESYFRPVIMLGFLDGGWLRLVCLISAVLYAAVWARQGWGPFEEAKATRLLIVGTTAVLAYAFSAYSYNYYLDQPHLFGRALLVTLAVGMWWTPAVLPLFLLVCMSITFQFNYPMGGYSWTDKILLFRVLILFAASMPLQIILKRSLFREFTLLCCCMIAGHYFVPGLAKIQMDWWSHGKLYNLTAASYVNGWLAPLSASSLQEVIAWARAADGFMMAVTLLVELVAILFLAHRWSAQLLLLAWAVFHLGIFAASGIFFWKWILFELLLVVFLRQLTPSTERWLFSWPRFAVSAAVIALAGPLFQPVILAWYDTRLAYTFQFQGVGESGTTYPIGKYFLSPYDLQFAQNRFGFLTKDPMLVGTFGATQNEEVVKLLAKPITHREVEELARIHSRCQYHGDKCKCFDRLIRRYFVNMNDSLDDKRQPFFLRTPLHIWTLPRDGDYCCQEPLVAVNVSILCTMYDRQRGIVELAETPVRSVEIPRTLDRK